LENRVCKVINEVGSLDWPHLKSVAMIEATRRSGQKVSTETRYYLTILGAPRTKGSRTSSSSQKSLGH
jgi:hypothetical protein